MLAQDILKGHRKLFNPSRIDQNNELSYGFTLQTVNNFRPKIPLYHQLILTLSRQSYCLPTLTVISDNDPESAYG
jgi:hypothetical protein